VQTPTFINSDLRLMLQLITVECWQGDFEDSDGVRVLYAFNKVRQTTHTSASGL